MNAILSFAIIATVLFFDFFIYIKIFLILLLFYIICFNRPWNPKNIIQKL